MKGNYYRNQHVLIQKQHHNAMTREIPPPCTPPPPLAGAYGAGSAALDVLGSDECIDVGCCGLVSLARLSLSTDTCR